MIELLGTGGTIPIANDTINNLANATLSPTAGWILMAAAVFAYAVVIVPARRSATPERSCGAAARRSPF